MKSYTNTTFDSPNMEVIYNKLNELISPYFQTLEGVTYKGELITRYVVNVICYENESFSKNTIRRKHSCVFDFKVCFYDGIFYIKHKERIFLDEQLKMLLEEFTNYIFKTVEKHINIFFSNYTINIVEFPPSLLDNP